MSNFESSEYDKHLEEEHGLVKTTVYFPSKKQQSDGAKRTAQYRQRKKERGIVQVDVPAAILEEIKVAGSFESWMNQFHRIPPDQFMINRKIKIADKVLKFPRWLRRLLRL